MPLYEFRCKSCGRKATVFVRSLAQPVSPACAACGSGDMARLISGFAYHRSLDSVWENSGDPDRPGPDYYSDPRNVGRWAEKKFAEMGQEMPPEAKEMIRKARQGEMPDSAKDLQPGLGEV